ncbi:MAG: hypothetical protein JXO22_13945 [Phycisphaerae bacterium]|nr:hypothetical protein [Phycisphaerae bacterium]
MSEDLRQLEQQAESASRLLDVLRTPAPSGACVKRVKSAVSREAAQYRRRRRLVRLVESFGAVAAVIALVMVLRWPTPTTSLSTSEADAYINAWVVAADQSRTRFATLLDESSGGTSEASADDAAFNDLLSNLDLVLGGEI